MTSAVHRHLQLNAGRRLCASPMVSRPSGVALTPSSYDELGWQQEAWPTAVSPFPEATDYLGDSKQIRAAGIGVEGDRRHYRNGRFARLRDPEGNPVGLWQPAGRALPYARVPLSDFFESRLTRWRSLQKTVIRGTTPPKKHFNLNQPVITSFVGPDQPRGVSQPSGFDATPSCRQ
jgi:hypothetical protein